MGSSYFPLRDNDWKGRVPLLDLLKELEEMAARARQSAMEGDDGQYDNSTYDGIYTEKIEIAIQLLREAMGVRT